MIVSTVARSARTQTRPADQRRFARVPVALLGRYMLADRQEYPCQTVDVSPGGALLVAPVRGAVGERVIAYLEHLGRVEGEIARHAAHGFAFTINAAPLKREKLVSQLTWLANRQALGLPEDRRHERIVPRRTLVILRLESGREIQARLVDVSLSGAGLTTESRVPIGAAVTVGSTPGKVVRHFTGGVAVEFRLPISPDRLDENVIL